MEIWELLSRMLGTQFCLFHNLEHHAFLLKHMYKLHKRINGVMFGYLTSITRHHWDVIRISFVTSQVSHPYKSTDFTQALKILILVTLRNDHTSWYLGSY